MENQELFKLIEQSLQNDQTAFRKIVETYQSMIFTLSFRLTGNEEEAKDVVQEAFIKVWLHLASYNQQQKFSTWLYRIATNICIDKLKKHHLLTTNYDDTLAKFIKTDDTEEILSNKELAEVILTLTNELSPKQRIVFTLRYLEDIEINEIVRITGMSADKIKSNLYVARQTIRKKLEKY
jgi:RNA polymerase sigma-70 factor, ECF subfamily